MRNGRDNGLLKSESGKLVGINLGADYCAEHEWGIKQLRESFGIPDTGYGLQKRTITKQPTKSNWQTNETKPILRLIEKKNETILVCDSYLDDDKLPKNHVLERYKGNDDKLITAWDEKSFGINAAKPEDRIAVRSLHAAIQHNDVAIWLGGGGVFQNAGLVLAIASAIPAASAQMLYDADVDREKLADAATATGIAVRLEKAGKRYYALSPRWPHAEEKKKTKYSVMFWLNPMEQHIHNFGWFTVEELEQWANGEGPCMMSKEQIAQRGRR